jgi:hypothetical protein
LPGCGLLYPEPLEKKLNVRVTSLIRSAVLRARSGVDVKLPYAFPDAPPVISQDPDSKFDRFATDRNVMVDSMGVLVCAYTGVTVPDVEL